MEKSLNVAHAGISAHASLHPVDVTVAFRIFLLLPHLIVLGFLGVAWCMTTIISRLSMLFTGEFPRALYEFGVGMLRWSTRVEAYLLLLHDEYSPFAFA